MKPSTKPYGKPLPRPSRYARFAQIDGSHDFRAAVPDGFVDYEVRTRHGGRVAYFNFDLGRAMGLIPRVHEAALTPALEAAILEAFAIQIINEYDIIHKSRIPARDRRPRKYMATRYLQLQHACRRGKTSGDGRSIWNGQLTHAGTTWDITSCGTGATALSPAAAKLGFTPQTGDPNVSYGCGMAEIDEGISAAIQSEIFHRNGVPTERTLAVIAFEDGTSINVRAGTCLLRPSHFFLHLKQGNRESLRGAIDYFVARQSGNGGWPDLGRGAERYFALASHLAGVFARMAATFESEYIFVWMDWDGDNILAQGGIIDYGSVRQFGLYHHAYRFDDDGRWSTTIPEQRLKARETVQAFIQIADFLATGRKRNFRRFRRHPILREFDREFARERLRLFLKKTGFDEGQQAYLLEHQRASARRMHAEFSRFERAARPRSHRVPDGVTRDAVYCMRDLLREFPAHRQRGQLGTEDPATPARFLRLMASRFATRRDLRATPRRQARVSAFLREHARLVDATGRDLDVPRDQLLGAMARRAALLNPHDRLTGEAIIYLTARLVRARARGLRRDSLQRLVQAFIQHYVYAPDPAASGAGAAPESLPKATRDARIFHSGLKLVEASRESL